MQSNPEGVVSLSPGLLYSATLGNRRPAPANPNGVVAQEFGHFHPEGVTSLSPGLLYSATLENGRRAPANPNGVVASVPHITLIPFYVVLAEQGPELILKTQLPMMLFLVSYVSLHPL